MKLSIVIASSDAPETAFVVWRGFEESIRKASEFGFDGVELALKDAGEINPKNLDRWLGENNIQVSAISTGQVFAVRNLSFVDAEKSRWEELRSIFRELIALASDFGNLINIGRVRGSFAANRSRGETEKLFVARLQEIAEEADKKIVGMMIEPVNRYEINFLNRVEQTAEILRSVTNNNVYIMPDVFHMNIEDVSIGGELTKYNKHIKYIHLADSNRLAPGRGHLDFVQIFDDLKKSSWDGWVAAEILPFPSPDQAAKQAATFLQPLVLSYNNS